MEFEETIKKIQKAYIDLGHEMGYRFLLSSKNTFSSDVLFLNLNPGGSIIPPNHPSDSCETGPAHLTESWKNGHPVGMSPLQIQVQRMFTELSKRIPGNRDLLNEALIAYFIPFRSPRIENLHAKEKSISFAIELWSEILENVKPKLIICLGNDVYENIKQLFPDTPVIFNTNIGWKHGKGGEVTAQVYTYKNGCRILKLPHLSTYKIFSRDESKPFIDKLLNEATKNW